MKKEILLSVIVWLVGPLAWNMPAAQQMTQGESEFIVEGVSVEDIDEIFSTYISDDAPGCAVSIYLDGESVFSKGYGLSNLDYGIALSDTSAFYMASVSKQVTAASAALLMIRGELDAEAGIEEYIEDWPEWASGVEVQHLFNHTSGLPDIYGLMDIANISLSNVMDLEDYLSVAMLGENLKFEPGSEYSYSNSGYTLLAYLVEKISGRDFSEFVDKELLKPFGMNSTHFHDDRHRIIPNRVISYQPGNPGFRRTYRGNFQGVGPGGLYSTLKDWEKWEAFWNGTLEWEEGMTEEEAEQLKQMMTTPQTIEEVRMDYAMGLNVDTRKGLRIHGHSGSFMGFKNDYRRYPDTGFSMLTLCNRGDADPQELNHEMADLLLAGQFEAFLAPYEGIYHNAELPADYKLSVEDGKLKLDRRLSPNGPMTEEDPDKWSAGSWDFEFSRDETDRITGFVVSTSRAKEVEFVKQD